MKRIFVVGLFLASAWACQWLMPPTEAPVLFMPFPVVPILIGAAFGAASFGVAAAAGAIAAGAATWAAALAAVSWGSLAAGAALGALSTLAQYLLAPKPTAPSGFGPATRTTRAAVIPARWALGRVRLGGLMAYYGQDKDTGYKTSKGQHFTAKDMWQIRVISEGVIDGLEGVFIDGEHVPLVRDDLTMTLDGETRTFERWVVAEPAAGEEVLGYRDRSLVEFFPMFAADGATFLPLMADTRKRRATRTKYVPVRTGGQGGGREGDGVPIIRYDPVQESYTTNAAWEGKEWTAEHKLQGMSYIGIRAHQPAYGFRGESESRYWTRLPEFEFVVRGIKLTYPGQDVPIYTANAAAIRYWWDTQRRGIPADEIDEEQFTRAWAICNQTITRTLTKAQRDAGYLPNVKRYTINGIVEADDNIADVEQGFDICWLGYAIDAGGTRCYRPGATRAPVHTIRSRDWAEFPVFQPSRELTNKVNSARATIAQSIHHDFSPFDIGQVDDEPAIERDGVKRARDLGVIPYTNDPLVALRLIASLLRGWRYEGFTISGLLKPGGNLENMALKPTDIVKVDLPEYGYGGAAALSMMVVERELRPDLSVHVRLHLTANDVYSDTSAFPPLVQIGRGPDFDRRVPDRPQNVEVQGTAFVAEDGAVQRRAFLQWQDLGFRGEVRWRRGNPAPVQLGTRIEGRRYRDQTTTDATTDSADHDGFPLFAVTPGETLILTAPENTNIHFYSAATAGIPDLDSFIGIRANFDLPWVGANIPVPDGAAWAGIDFEVEEAITVHRSPDSDWQLFETPDNHAVLLLESAGDYMFAIRHLSKYGIASAWHTAFAESITFTGDVDPPGEVQGFIAEAGLGNIRVVGIAPFDDDVRGIQIYAKDYATGTTAPAAPDLTRGPNVFIPAAPGEVFAGAVPAISAISGGHEWRLWARTIDSSGNAGTLSDAVDLGDPRTLQNHLDTFGECLLIQMRNLIARYRDNANLITQLMPHPLRNVPVANAVALGSLPFIYTGGDVRIEGSMEAEVEIPVEGQNPTDITPTSSDVTDVYQFRGGGITPPVDLPTLDANFVPVQITFYIHLEIPGRPTQQIQSVSKIFGGSRELEVRRGRVSFSPLHVHFYNIHATYISGPGGVVGLATNMALFTAAQLAGWGAVQDQQLTLKAYAVRTGIPAAPNGLQIGTTDLRVLRGSIELRQDSV